jgi:hypothetical protein
VDSEQGAGSREQGGNAVALVKFLPVSPPSMMGGFYGRIRDRKRPFGKNTGKAYYSFLSRRMPAKFTPSPPLSKSHHLTL